MGGVQPQLMPEALQVWEAFERLASPVTLRPLHGGGGALRLRTHPRPLRSQQLLGRGARSPSNQGAGRAVTRLFRGVSRPVCPANQESIQPGAGRAATLLFRGVSRPMWPLVPISAPFSRGKYSFREAEPSAQGPWLEGDQPGVSPAPTRPSTCPAPRSPGGSPASCLSSVVVI